MCARCTGATRKRFAAALFVSVFAMNHLPSVSMFGSKAAPGISISGAAMWGATSAQAEEAKASLATEKPQKYTCPMHPHYIADEFGTCPICGMDLVKLNAGGADFNASASEQRAAITIPPEVIQNMGVRIGKAERTRFGRRIRSYGIVHANERLQNEFTSRFEGWIEKLYVTAVGDEVRAGAKLFEVYSPQLITSQNDYFLSRSDQRLADRALAQLRSFGVQSQALELIRQRTEPLQFVPFFSERTGTVATLGIRQGSYVRRGMMLAMVQDYSEIWLRAGVAEKDLGFIANGNTASISFPNMAGRKVSATVDYIYPTIDTTTRTGQVRLVLENKDGQIRPGTYADIEFQVDSEERTAVPSEAVLRSGQGKYVVVSLGQGRFEPRLVETGLVTGRWTEVTRGVAVGEDIVVSGQFLLDSESALRESFHKLERLQTPLSLLQLNKTEFAMVDHLVDAALYLHEALVDGFEVAPAFLDPAISVRAMLWPKFKNTKLAFVLNDAVAALETAKVAKTESEVQAALYQLTGALKPWILQGAPDHYQARKLALFTDVASKRTWAQLAGKPANPYGRGATEAIAWPTPVSRPDAKSTSDAPAKQTENTPKGSHSGN